MEPDLSSQPLVVPDRFESLQRKTGEGELSSIVVPVEESLAVLDAIFRKMGTAGRGAFLILRGPSGAGKSTFLHTLRFFRKDVVSISVPADVPIREALETHKPGPEALEVLVLEEREAAVSFTDSELEDWLHAINGFIRKKGHKALVVWPCNTDALRDRIIKLATAIGDDALLGTGEPYHQFRGPTPAQYPSIAQTTIAVLNQSATFSDLGLSDELVAERAQSSKTIGAFLGRLSEDIDEQERRVQQLVARERCRLWVIVVAGNDPAGDVSGLTRGRYAAIDTERLLAATGANIVVELKKQPERIGILGTVLDARILHLPVLAALDIMRAFSDDSLKTKMKSAGLSLKPDSKSAAVTRLNNAEIAQIFRAGSQGTLSVGPKLGSSSFDAFSKIADIATGNDAMLNRAIGRAFKQGGLIQDFAVEQDFGTGMKRRTDILAQTDGGPIRIEVMWRKTTGRAAIANYTLTKLANYGRAVGYLN